ncbi:hypothetical protein Tco_0840038 [Tanacetum coccineum]|uniref:Reverse transcriptase domain-containing protein n=1 Tax=Tanacetum coccineum TaxID=301880 RepID=A0ABQ5ATK2_9ASTR
MCAFVCSRLGALVMSVIEMGRLNIEYEWERIQRLVYANVVISDVDTIMRPRMRTRSAGLPAAELLGGGMGVRVGRGRRGRRPREEGVNGNLEGANGGAPDFSTIITQQLQNLLPAILAQENVGNVLMNGNRVGCSYKEFLACNPKEYNGKGCDVVLTRWIEKMEYVHDMSGCNVDQKVKYTAGLFMGKALTW